MSINIGGMKNNTVVKRNALILNRQFHLLLIITRWCIDLMKIYFTDVETKAHIPGE